MTTHNGTHPPPPEQPDLSDWISVRDATRLVPSPRGNRTHTSTIVRWIMSGKLVGWRRGRYWWVRRSEVLDLLGTPPPEVQRRPTRAEQAKVAAWARRVCDQARI